MCKVVVPLAAGAMVMCLSVFVFVCVCVQCAVPYACMDWDNRFTVARRAREEKYDLVF